MRYLYRLGETPKDLEVQSESLDMKGGNKNTCQSSESSRTEGSIPISRKNYLKRFETNEGQNREMWLKRKSKG